MADLEGDGAVIETEGGYLVPVVQGREFCHRQAGAAVRAGRPSHWFCLSLSCVLRSWSIMVRHRYRLGDFVSALRCRWGKQSAQAPWRGVGAARNFHQGNFFYFEIGGGQWNTRTGFVKATHIGVPLQPLDDRTGASVLVVDEAGNAVQAYGSDKADQPFSREQRSVLAGMDAEEAVVQG